MKKLQNITAVITGASSGIGEGIAKGLALEGANVVLAARSVDKLAQIKREINEQGNENVLTVQTDVSIQQDIDNLVKKAEAAFDHIDVLVNNAGQMLTAPVLSGKVGEWEQMIDVNIKGLLYGIHSVLPAMLNRSSGHIINVASVSSFEVTKNSTVYSATKSAVQAISTGLEKELARTGVRITNISPGMVDTRASGDIPNSDRKKLETSDIANAVIYAITQPPYVNVNEITIRPV